MINSGELAGQILTPGGAVSGRILWRDGLIERIEKAQGAPELTCCRASSICTATAAVART